MCRPLNAGMMETTPSDMAAVASEYMPQFVFGSIMSELCFNR